MCGISGALSFFCVCVVYSLRSLTLSLYYSRLFYWAAVDARCIKNVLIVRALCLLSRAREKLSLSLFVLFIYCYFVVKT